MPKANIVTIEHLEVKKKSIDMIKKIRKSASITNDCLIAASVRSIGGVLYTQNKRDFQAIQDIFDFKVSFVHREID